MKSKKLKGMTLMEIIISMVIFSVSALILVQGAISVYYSMRKTRKLVKKINYQAPIADRMNDSGTEINNISSTSIPPVFVLSANGKNYSIEVDEYQVNPNTTELNQPAGDFKYFKYKKPTP